MAFLKRRQVADFFLNEENPYSKKRTIKAVHVALTLGVFAVFVLIAGSILEQRDNQARVIAQAAKDAKSTAVPPPGTQSPSSDNQGFVSLNAGAMGSRPSTGGQRQASATQIIKRGESFADTLPIGTQLSVQLTGRVESMDTNSPVTATLLQDALSPAQALVIPRGTTVIGTGQLDVNRERLQVRFHTFVLPEGQQYNLSGLAMMSDGSSGLVGEFSSGQLKRNVSQFLGNFVGGLAQGMKDKSPSGQLGIPVEAGSLKNGILNGVAQSSLDYAKSASEQIGQTGASITVNSGTKFTLYLEREFHP